MKQTFRGHLRAFGIAALFGLGVYALIIGLAVLARLAGLQQ